MRKVSYPITSTMREAVLCNFSHRVTATEIVFIELLKKECGGTLPPFDKITTYDNLYKTAEFIVRHIAQSVWDVEVEKHKKSIAAERERSADS